jgi:transposase
MGKLSIEAKQMIVEKALNRKGKSVAEIAALHNIGYSTLDTWIRKSRAGTLKGESKVTSEIPMAREERFGHLIATGCLDEVGIGAYCRERGLYSHQLEEWKKDFMTETKEPISEKQKQSEIKALRAENTLLKQDLRRKDRALSETTALLILKKKANLIWGEFADV